MDAPQGWQAKTDAMAHGEFDEIADYQESNMNSNTLKAKSLLVHYFRLLARKNDIGWDSDNDTEVEQIVDLIIAAAVEEMQSQSQEDDESGESWRNYQEFKRNRNKAMGYE